MDKLVPIRSVVGAQDDHDATQCYTGRHPRIGVPVRRLAAIGIGRLETARSARAQRAPLREPVLHDHARPVQRAGSGIRGRVARFASVRWGPAARIWCCKGSRHDQLGHRQALLASLDRFRREADGSGKMHGMDSFTEQAMGILTSSRLADALDLSKEDPASCRTLWHRRREDSHRRKRRPARAAKFSGRAAAGRSRGPRGHAQLQQMGLARPSVRLDLRSLQGRPHGIRQGLFGALIEDLHERGLDKDVTVGRVGRVRPHADDQQERRPRSLAARRLRTVGRRRHEDRASDRRDRSAGRRSGRPAR